MRRPALAAAVVTLAAAGMAQSALAAPQDWAGSQVATASPAGSTAPSLDSIIVRAYNPDVYYVDARTELIAPAERPAGCTSSVGSTSVGPRGDGNAHRASAPANVNCNGSYTVRVTASLVQRSFFGGNPRVVDQHQFEGSVDIVAPPPDVATSAAVPGEGRSVLISWTPIANAPPDFLGYRVERVSASGETATIATIDDRNASSYTDEEPPAEGGSTTYRVVGRRASTQGEISSVQPSTSSAEVEPVPDDPDDPDGPADPGDPGDPASPGDPGTAPATPGGSGGPSQPGGGGSFRPPAIGRSGNVVPPLSSTVTTLDTGFDDELPFGDRELGAEDPVLPDDEFASLIYEDEAGRGLVIPIATGILLVVWALHLRYLARASRPIDQ